MKKRILIIADPVDQWVPNGETTFYIVAEACLRGIEVFHTTLRGLVFDRGEWVASCRKLHVKSQDNIDSPFPFELERTPIREHLKHFDSIHLRKDPPVDIAYIQHLQFLTALENEVPMFNRPSSLLRWNEKLAILNFSNWILPTRVAFPGEIKDPMFSPLIRKSLEDAQGRGVHLYESPQDVPPATDYQSMVMDQPFNPLVSEGDKRILLFDGDCVGFFVRVPKTGHFLANLRHGARVESCELTEREWAIVKDVGKWAKHERLFLLGLDVIGERLSEINMTSVRGIREFLRAGGSDLSVPYWDRVEASS